MPANLTNPAFCVLPFIEKFQSLNGKKYLYCHSNVPVESQNLLKIQQDIFNGRKILVTLNNQNFIQQIQYLKQQLIMCWLKYLNSGTVNC
jgi:hypothetical protein